MDPGRLFAAIALPLPAWPGAARADVLLVGNKSAHTPWALDLGMLTTRR